LNRGDKVTAIVRNVDKLKNNTNPNLTVVEGDATDPAFLSSVAKGKDAVISAFNSGWNNPNQYADNISGNAKIIEGVKESGVKRFLQVGGAGALFIKPGVRIYEAGIIPEESLGPVKAMAEIYLEMLPEKAADLDWVHLMPAANLGNLKPGSRTGKYRMSDDTMLVDEKGDNFISVEDYAVAMADELENPKHHQEGFSVAY
ncbi:MAG: NAD(P)H-binding protein, partial [Muribaculaceae bacterium]|nr:NAD(P)H-binding protein [Muribaculaceae bacterium]